MKGLLVIILCLSLVLCGCSASNEPQQMQSVETQPTITAPVPEPTEIPETQPEETQELEWTIDDTAMVYVLKFPEIFSKDEQQSNSFYAGGNSSGVKYNSIVRKKEPFEDENYTPTLGDKNALEKAKSYLRSSSFSYQGLIEQLEFEGFTTQEAKYGVSKCGADWYEQAAKKAKSYLRSSSFSKTGLIEQLEFEGFTYDQAVYGVKSVGY